MKTILQLGIPSFDALFGHHTADRDSWKTYAYDAHGLVIDDRSHATSMCFIGPDGSGKSAFGLHLAAQYVADTFSDKERPYVLYVSTDLKHHVAEAMWNNFGLLYPNQRDFPFFWGYRHGCQYPGLKVELTQLDPTDVHSMLVSQRRGNQGLCGQVHFVDLVSNTMGDDWGFINRLLAVLELPKTIPHLLIIDAVEGFETLVGERDAFGETTSRRARVAQIMRTAGDKCHIAFIVEEPKSEERFPEEFVTDVVVRLRNVTASNYARRTVEVVKARGQAHIRGQHPFVIRDRIGSTTATQENADDPEVDNSYIHVYPSLHYLSRVEMRARGRRNPPPRKDRVAAFGITYLDEMLSHLPAESGSPRGFDQEGLPVQTTTALIGEVATEKTSLATAFLARTFRSFTFRLMKILNELSDPSARLANTRRALKFRLSFEARITGKGLRLADITTKLDELMHCIRGCIQESNSENSQELAKFKELLKRLNLPSVRQIQEELSVFQGPELVKFAAWLAESFEENGAVVLLTTGDHRRDGLVRQFEQWLEHSRQLALEHRPLGAKCPIDESFRSAFKRAVREHIKSRTICRRLELHDMSSVSLFHVIQRSVERAQQLVFLSDDLLRPVSEPKDKRQAVPSKAIDRLPVLRSRRFVKSWNIRVVIDDLSTLKETYPDISADPLFLPFLLSYLELEGVTALVIDSHEGRPGAPVTDAFHHELRALVPHRLHTWRVTFQSEMRDAITVLPPFPTGLPSCVREVRWEQRDDETSALLVDPELELYSGLKKGEPKPIPLQIRLYQEAGPSANYIREENEIFGKLFTPLSDPGSSGQVIVGTESNQYDTLWNFCNLQTGTLLDYTLLLQVDEFWAIDRETTGDLSSHPARPISRRGSRLYPLGSYLTELTSISKEKVSSKEKVLVPDSVADPFGLFQGRPSHLDYRKSTGPGNCHAGSDKSGSAETIDSGPWERRCYFPRYRALSEQKEKRSLDPRIKDRIDRVPFTWDFGFLLCPRRMWDLAEGRPIEGQDLKVHEVWQALAKVGEAHVDTYISWRTFLGACKTVAQVQAERTPSPVCILDLAMGSGESFSCLMLEIWASEIYDKLLEGQQRDFAEALNHVSLESQGKEGLIEWLQNPEYRMAFYRSWLLLVDTLQLSEFVDRRTSPRLIARSANSSAVATRHWYKTACGNQECTITKSLGLPVRLPGHFSVRGDWFLALAGGSRSERLGRRALDLLSSRRANFRRMELGIGLPTRDISTLEVLYNLPTALVKQDEFGNTSAITYKDLTGPEQFKDKEGNPIVNVNTLGVPRAFNWLWRSQLRDYHRHSRLWQRWISQIMVMWDDLRAKIRADWRQGFAVYDMLKEKSFEESQAIISEHKLTSWNDFDRMCRLLIQELQIASRLPPEAYSNPTTPSKTEEA